MNSTIELLTHPITIAILACIAAGAYNGIQNSKTDGIEITAVFCLKYVFVYVTLWLTSIIVPIYIFTLILPYLS